MKRMIIDLFALICTGLTLNFNSCFAQNDNTILKNGKRMLKKIVCLLLINSFLYGISMSQENSVELKTVDNAYETILHFSPEDYHLSARGPGDERPRYGAQGIYAGDRYLVVWDINNFYVFDIQSYQKLATVATEFSIKDIVESDGVIYCLTINDYIYKYPSFENAIKNRFISTYKNLSDFNLNKKLLQSRKHRKGET